MMKHRMTLDARHLGQCHAQCRRYGSASYHAANFWGCGVRMAAGHLRVVFLVVLGYKQGVLPTWWHFCVAV